MDAADAGASPPYDPDVPVGVGLYPRPQQSVRSAVPPPSVAGRKRRRDADDDDDDADYEVGQRPAFAVDDDDDDDADDAEGEDTDESAAADYQSAHAAEYNAAAASASASSKRRRKETAAEPAGPPATAEEYLRMVRREARRCPAVVVSAIDPRKFDSKQTSYMPKIERSVECPSHLLPKAEWELAFASDFADLRQALVRSALQSAAHATERPAFPVKSDSAGWVKFCLGTEWRFVEPAHVTLALHRKRTAKQQQPSSAAAAAATAAAPSADDSDDDAEASPAAAATAPATADGVAAAAATAGAAAGAGAGAAAAAAAAAALPCTAPPKLPRLPLLRALDHQRTRSLLLLLIDYLHAHVTDQQCRSATGAPGADAPGARAAAAAADAAVGAAEEQNVWPLTPLLSVWLFALTAKSEKPIDMSTAAALRTLYRDVCVLRARMTDAGGSAVARCNILLTIVHRCFDQKVDTA